MGACCCSRSGRTKCLQNDGVDDTDSLLGKRSDVELHSTLPSGEHRHNHNKAKHKNSDCDEDLEQIVDSSNSSVASPQSSPLSLEDGIAEGDSCSRSSRRLEVGRRQVRSTFKSPKAVRFGCVRSREYSRCMDFHPCVSTGVPLGLDWEFDQNEDLSLDEYEAMRRDAGRVERQSYAGRGRLEPRLRLSLALYAGHTMEEVNSMNEQVEVAKVERYNDFIEAQTELRQQRQQQLLEKQRALERERAKNPTVLGIPVGKGTLATWLFQLDSTPPPPPPPLRPPS